MPALADITLNMVRARCPGKPMYRRIGEAASQSFKKGQLVTIASAALSIFATDTNNLTSSGALLYGIAEEDATGVTGNKILVRVFTEQDELILPVWDDTPASAVVAESMIGETRQLTNQGGIPFVDLDVASGTNSVVQIVDIVRDHPLGELYGFVVVRPIAAERFVS